MHRIIPHSLADRKATLAKWTLAGILVRILILPITGSRDLGVTTWASLVFLEKHQLIQSNDPPFLFLFFAAILGIFSPLIPAGIKSFYLSSTNYSPSEVLQVLALARPGIQQTLVVMKLPFFFFDLGIGVMLLHLIEDTKKAMFGYKLWLFNPISIAVSYAIGQYDVMATFFIVLALLLYKKGYAKSTALSLGVAGAIKAVGLLLLIPYGILQYKKASQISAGKGAIALSKTILIGIIPLILGYLPLQAFPTYYESANLGLPSIYQNGFYGLTLWNRGLVGSSLFVGIETFVLTYSISFQTGVSWDAFFVLPLLYIGLLLALVHFKGWTFKTMIDSFLIFLLAYYALDTFHAQWFLWAQPLLVILVVTYYKKLRNVYWATCALFFPYLLNFGGFLTVGLFVPIYPPAMAITISLPTIISVSFRMLLSVILVYMCILIFLERWGRALPWRVSMRVDP
jgi:hypothetical protein